jgi:hypothetical protein
MSVGQLLLEQKFLNQNTISHVYDRAILALKCLHTYMVAHTAADFAINLRSDSNGQASRCNSSGLTDGNSC